MAKKTAVKKATKKAPAKKAATKSRAAHKVATVRKKPLTAAQRRAKAKREIAVRNKRFKAANAAGKRVLIAQDVIDQVELGKFRPAVGTWVAAPQYAYRADKDVNRAMDYEEFEKRSVREDFFADVVGTCECCALGAMFMGCTLNNNKTTARDLDEMEYGLGEAVSEGEKTGPLANGLTKFFSLAQLTMIEQAFEGGKGAFKIDLFRNPDDDTDLDVERAPTDKEAALLAWEKKYPNAKKRLVAIMQNIVDNDGTFIP